MKSKNSLQRRQKQFFEQRRQDQQLEAANGTTSVPNHQQSEASPSNVLQSLDIQCLQRLCEDIPPSKEPTSSGGGTTGKDGWANSYEILNSGNIGNASDGRANSYEILNSGNTGKASDGRIRPPVPDLLQKVGSWLNLSGGARHQEDDEAETLYDATYQKLGASSGSAACDLDMQWESHDMDTQRLAFEFNAEQVTFPDELMLRPGSLGSPCFGGSPSTVFQEQEAYFYPGDQTLSAALMNSIQKPRQTACDFDFDLQPRSRHFSCGMPLETQRYEYTDLTFEKARNLGTDGAHGIGSPDQFTFISEAPDLWNSYHLYRPDEEKFQDNEPSLRIQDFQLSGEGRTPIFGITFSPELEDIEFRRRERGLRHHRNPANPRHESQDHSVKADSGQNLNFRGSLKRKLVHDASSSSKGNHCIASSYVSPVSNLRSNPQGDLEKMQYEREHSRNFWVGQGSFLQSPEMPHGFQNQAVENETVCWTQSRHGTPRADHSHPDISDNADFDPCQDQLSRLTSACSSKSLDVQVIGPQRQQHALENTREAAYSNRSLQSVLHEPCDPWNEQRPGIRSTEVRIEAETNDSQLLRKGVSERSVDLPSFQNTAMKNPSPREWHCASPVSKLQPRSPGNIEVDCPQGNRIQQTGTSHIRTAREVSSIPFKGMGYTLQDVEDSQLPLGQFVARQSPSCHNGSKVDPPTTISSLPRAGKHSPLTSLQSQSSAKNYRGKRRGSQRSNFRSKLPGSSEFTRDGSSGNLVISAQHDYVKRSQLQCTLKTESPLQVLEDATEKNSSWQEREGDIVMMAKGKVQTSRDPRSVGSEMETRKLQSVSSGNKLLFSDTKVDEPQTRTSQRKPLSNDNLNPCPTTAGKGPVSPPDVAEAQKRHQNPTSCASTKSGRDQDYVGMLESYVLQLNLVNQILLQTAQRIEDQ